MQDEPRKELAPKVSIVMAVHGGGKWLEQAIDSVDDQSMHDWELVCVLDDVTAEVDRILTQRMADSRIRFIRLGKTGGATVARNMGLVGARGAMIAILDSDDQWTPDHLELAVNYLEENHDVLLVGSRYQRVDSDGLNLGVAVRVPRRLVAVKMLVRNAFCHSAVVYRRAVAESVGGYPDGVSIGEDYCLWLKLAGMGKVHNLEEVSVKYRRHENQISREVLDQTSSSQILDNKLELARKLRIPSRLVKILHSFWLKRQNLEVG